MNQSKKIRFILAVILCLFSQLSLSLSAETILSNEAIAELKAYGTCLEKMDKKKKIISLMDLHDANITCEAHLKRVAQLSPEIAKQIEQKLKAALQ